MLNEKIEKLKKIRLIYRSFRNNSRSSIDVDAWGMCYPGFDFGWKNEKYEISFYVPKQGIVKDSQVPLIFVVVDPGTSITCELFPSIKFSN